MCSFKPSKVRKLNHNNTSIFTHTKDKNQYEEIVSTLNSVLNENEVIIGLDILQNIGEFATGIIIQCPGKARFDCINGYIHHLYGNNFQILNNNNNNNNNHVYGQDNNNNHQEKWQMHKYECDNIECNIKYHVFECDACTFDYREDIESKFHVFECIDADVEIYPNHACTFASECKSIFCAIHWEDQGVRCEYCSNYFCADCSYHDGYHCLSCDCTKYFCGNCVPEEPPQNVPFYCPTCSRSIV